MANIWWNEFYFTARRGNFFNGKSSSAVPKYLYVIPKWKRLILALVFSKNSSACALANHPEHDDNKEAQAVIYLHTMSTSGFI